MEKWVDRGRFRTTPSGVEKWFTDLPPVRIAMEAGTHSIWVSEQLQELGHEVIVANVRELRAISHSDRKSDTVDAEKIARYARLRKLHLQHGYRGDNWPAHQYGSQHCQPEPRTAPPGNHNNRDRDLRVHHPAGKHLFHGKRNRGGDRTL
jgi:hypothetical protein